MKKIVLNSIIISFILFIYSCKPVLDNYAAPDQTLSGKIIDASTGDSLQVESNGNVKIRIEDQTWKAQYGSVSPQDLNVRGDGIYTDSKLFSGKYKIYPYNGPFVPYYYTGTTPSSIDNRDSIEINGGITTKDFTVEPFLKVEWVTTSLVLNTDTTVTVVCTFSRGTQQAAWQFNVTDVQLYVSRTPYVGNSDYEPSMSKGITYSGTAGNALLGTSVTITSGKLISGSGHGSRTWYFRIGARTADPLQKLYNYTKVKSITFTN